MSYLAPTCVSSDTVSVAGSQSINVTQNKLALEGGGGGSRGGHRVTSNYGEGLKRFEERGFEGGGQM